MEVEVARWAPEPIWTLWTRQIYVAPLGSRIPYHQARETVATRTTQARFPVPCLKYSIFNIQDTSGLSSKVCSDTFQLHMLQDTTPKKIGNTYCVMLKGWEGSK